MLSALYSEMNSHASVVTDPVFHPFTVSICDRTHGSQIPILHVQLRHILFEETLEDFIFLLYQMILQPLSHDELPLFEAYGHLVEFFAEGATLTMDENLNYYESHELVEIMRQFNRAFSFTIYYPQNGATRTLILRSTEDIQSLHEPFRLAGLLGGHCNPHPIVH